MSKKITFVTGSMGRGGAERVISILSRYYISKGWQVDIVMLLHSFNEYDLDQEVNVVDLSHSGGIRRGFIQTISKERQYMAREKPDVVVCFMAQNCLLTGIAMTGMSIPVIMSERIDPAEVNRNGVYKALLNHYYGSSAKVIFQTNRARNYFNNRIKANSCIIGNPIKVVATKGISSKHEIVTAGRMTEQKNHAMLISAFAKIYHNHPEYRLTIYGDGPLMDQLKEQREKLGLSSVVEFPGNVPNLHERIVDSEIFVLPSNFEGLSNALLEAMMLGLPVIATNCAGCDEVIENEKNGLLIPIGDESALIQALERYISNVEWRQDIANAGKKSVERFEVSNIINEWNEIITASIL